MAIIEVKVPQLSESVSEATLLDWHKKEGEPVARDENLIDIETDKVVLDVNQVLVARDRLAFLLVPVEERRFGDGLGKLRHLHFDDGHALLPFSFSPASAWHPPGYRKTSE